MISPMALEQISHSVNETRRCWWPLHLPKCAHSLPVSPALLQGWKDSLLQSVTFPVFSSLPISATPRLCSGSNYSPLVHTAHTSLEHSRINGQVQGSIQSLEQDVAEPRGAGGWECRAASMDVL